MKLLTLVVAIAAPAGLYANPTDPTVVSGSASFAASGATLTVTNSPSAIINWQSFSIGAPETTRFVQQNAASAVLNRVTGAESSQILGALQSNGQVFLINPAGVFFGAGARVDVAGLVASTLNLSNQDFLAGKLNFQAGPLAGSVINQGRIATPLGGSVILVGSSVENSGVINAPDGNVVLAAGSSVLIGDTGAPNVLVQVQATEEKAVNLGEVAVGRGEVGIYAGLVKQSGIVSADSAGVDAGGHIVFKAAKELLVDGDSVTSANGGRVELLGENVGVIDNAVVDASGASGGGTVLVGGDYRGANPSVANASAVFTGANSVIRADATQAGDGGKVVLWSEQATRAHGAISATGAGGGSGGFVETSSRGYLEVTQAPTLGAGGTWLLDPYDITVVAGSGLVSNTGAPNFTPNGSSSQVGADLVSGQLNAGTNVTLDTSGAGADAGNITVDAAITKSNGADATLTLKAHNNIYLTGNAFIQSTAGKLNVTLNSDQDGDGFGALWMQPPSSITTNGGNVVIGGGPDPALNPARASGDIHQGVQIQGAAIVTGAGSISIRGEGDGTSNTITCTIGEPCAFQPGVGVALVEGAYGISVPILAYPRLVTDSGSVTINGTVQKLAGAKDVAGVYISSTGSNAVIETGFSAGPGGGITIFGTGPGTAGFESGVNNRGVAILGDLGSSIVANNGGSIFIDGNAGVSSGGGNSGVLISGTVEAYGGGLVSITGNAGTSAAGASTGVLVDNGYVYSDADVVITGYAGNPGPGSNANTGVGILDTTLSFGAEVATQDGVVTITGIGPQDASTESQGVLIGAMGYVGVYGSGSISISGDSGADTSAIPAGVRIQPDPSFGGGLVYTAGHPSLAPATAGSVTITTTKGGIVGGGSVDTSGTCTTCGNDGGGITLDSVGAVDLAQVAANGSGGINGGNGGTITADALGPISIGTLKTLGGSASGADPDAGNGGAGGNATLTAGGAVTLGSVDVRGIGGSAGGASADGGAGGNLAVSGGGDLSIGSIVSSGGDGAESTSPTAGNGGASGNITLSTTGVAATISLTGTIRANGGWGGNTSTGNLGGTGGDGGTVIITGPNAGLTLGVLIEAIGGDGGFQSGGSGSGGAGGNGGSIIIGQAGNKIGSFTMPSAGELGVVGGFGGDGTTLGGNGGHAGTVSVTASGVVTIDGSYIEAGNGQWADTYYWGAGAGGSASAGGNGGNGGTVSLTSDTGVLVTNNAIIDVTPGVGGSDGGLAGVPGSISLTATSGAVTLTNSAQLYAADSGWTSPPLNGTAPAGGTITLSGWDGVSADVTTTISAVGALGDTDGVAGGHGGTINIYADNAAANAGAGANVSIQTTLDASGGSGGPGNFADAGAGGDGGAIVISAAGSVGLTSALANGGPGGDSFSTFNGNRGGGGGSIAITVSGSASTIGGTIIEARGGIGGQGFSGLSAAGDGGIGGSITLTGAGAGTSISVPVLDADGGDGNYGPGVTSAGGAGGTVTLQLQNGGALTFGGQILAGGGDSGSCDSVLCLSGGDGGTAVVKSLDGLGAITLASASIDLSGGLNNSMGPDPATGTAEMSAGAGGLTTGGTPLTVTGNLNLRGGATHAVGDEFSGSLTVSGQLALYDGATLQLGYAGALGHSADSLLLDPAAGQTVTLRGIPETTSGFGFLPSLSLTNAMTVTDLAPAGAGTALIDALEVDSTALAIDTHTLALANSAYVSTSDFAISSGLVAGAGTLYIGNSFTATGGSIAMDPVGSVVDITQTTGDLDLTVPITAESVQLAANAGSIIDGNGGSLNVSANSLDMQAAGGGVGAKPDPIDPLVNPPVIDAIETSVRYLSASSTGPRGAHIEILNNNPLSVPLSVVSASAGTNDISITNNTDILLRQNCPDGCFPGVGTEGGNILVQSTGGSIANDPENIWYSFFVPAWVSADGGDQYSSATNGNGGTVTLLAAGNIDLPGGQVSANGMPGPDLDAGAGGAVQLSAGGFITVGTASAMGGGGALYLGGCCNPPIPSTIPTWSGGTGGTATLTAAGAVSVETVDVSGGGPVIAYDTITFPYVQVPGTVMAGGDAGSIAITTGGNFGIGTWDGSSWVGLGVHADGGNGSSTSTDGSAGGAGGTVVIQGSGAGMNVMGALPISSSGGAGGAAAQDATPVYIGNGGNGGAAGSVNIETVQGGLLAGAFGSSILAMGGNGGLGIVDGSGGAGGTVTLSSLDGTNGPGALDIGAARPDSLYGGLSINAAGGGGLVLGPNGVGKLDVGSGGITQLVSDPGANLASTVPLEIVADGHVFLDNLANVVPILFGSVNGNLSLSNSGSIGLGDPGQPLRFLDAAGNIIVRVPHGVSVPNEIAVHQPVTAGGDIIFTADDLIIDPVNGSVTTGAGSANFFELHSVDTAPLVVDGSSQSLLDAISTPLLRLGSQATPLGVDVEFGIPSANPPITFATIGGLSVFTTGNVFQNAGASLVFNSGAKGLQLTAGDISLSDPGNAFAVLAGRSGTDLSVPDPGSFIVANSGGFTVGTVDGVAGVGSLANSVGNSLTALAGTITVASGIQVNGDWTLSSTLGTVNSLGSTIDVAPAGVLTIDNGLANAGQINLRNAVGQTATLTVNTGALANQSSGVIDSSGTVAAANTINANGSGVALDNQGTIQAAKPLAVNTGSGSFDHNGGTITGPGNITASTFNWTRGTISGSGTFTVVDATLNNLDSAGYTLDGRPMTVSNTLNFAGVSWLDMVNGSTLTVNGLATLDTSAISSSFFGINSSAGAPSSATFNGGIVKLGAQPFDLALTVNTSGTVTASQGQLAIDIGFTGAAGGTHTNTSFVANSGAEISLSAGTHVATGNVSFGGAGTVHLWWGGSTRPFPTVFDASAATAVNTGNLAIDNSGKFIGNLANAGTLTLGDATLDGALDNTGTVVFASGAVSQTGIFTNASTGIVNFNGGSYASPAAFDNQGTVNVNAGGLILDTGDVVGGGIFNVGAAGGLEFAAGTYSVGSIANGGTLVFSGGTATLAGNLDTLSGGTTNLNGGGLVIQASSVFGNAGTVNINAGTLTLNAGDGGTSGGTYSIPAGSGLVLAAGSYGIGNVTGAGRFEVSGGTANVTNASLTGTTAPDGAFLSAGALNVSGAASIASLGHTGGVLGGAGGSLTVASYVLNNPSGTGTIGGTFADLSLTSPGDLTISGFNVTATGSLHLDSTAGKLWIDGATVTGGDVTLAGNWLVVDGTSAAAKVTASGTMTINAGTVDVTAGAFSASIDPPTLAIVATGDVTLTGGTGATAFAEIAGGSVTVSAPNVSLVGGAGADAYARIDASTGNLALTLPGSLSMTAGAGANADAVLTAPLGAIQVVTTTCAGCIALSADPLANTSSAETGGYAPVGGVTFSLPPSAPPVVDSGIVQATDVASSAGSGTSNVSNAPSGGEENGDDDADKRRKSKNVCRG